MFDATGNWDWSTLVYAWKPEMQFRPCTNSWMKMELLFFFVFFFQVTPVHHWQDIVLIDCGSEKPCFQSDLLNLDAFLMIFHCDRDSLRSYAWCDPSPEILTVAVDNRRCRTYRIYSWYTQRTSRKFRFLLILGLLVLLYLYNKHARFHWDIY